MTSASHISVTFDKIVIKVQIYALGVFKNLKTTSTDLCRNYRTQEYNSKNTYSVSLSASCIAVV